MNTDKIFAAISMLTLMAFLAVVMGFVREPDLWIVIILVMGGAIVFFRRDLKSSGDQAQDSTKTD